MKKWLIPFLIIATIAGILCIFILCVDMSPPTYMEVQKIFEQDQELLLTVATYFEDLGDAERYEYIFWDLRDPSYSRGPISMKHSAVAAEIEQLKDRGYRRITRNGNTVDFLLYIRGADVSCGIAYSIDGKALNIQFLTERKPLPVENWHYYVADFSEWRIRSTAEAAPTAP